MYHLYLQFSSQELDLLDSFDTERQARKAARDALHQAPGEILGALVTTDGGNVLAYFSCRDELRKSNRRPR